MEAKIVRVSGEEVTIERKDDQREFSVSTSIFSEEDRAFIRTWEEVKRLSRDDALEIRVQRSRTQKSDSHSASTRREAWEEGYSISVTNETFGDFEDLVVRYRIFKFDQAVAAHKRSDGSLERLEGEYKIARLARDATHEEDTKKFPMSASKLKGNWYYVGGGRKKSEDELDGCWVRIYKGERMVREFSLPSTLPREHEWEPGKVDPFAN